MKVKPLRTEKTPIPLIYWSQPYDSTPYTVKDNDTWASVARDFSVEPGKYFTGNSTQYLIWFNFRTNDTDEVNWYLREFVGCNVSKDGGNNWAFSDSADPGVIYIPHRIRDFEEEEGTVIVGKKGIKGNVISAPGYDDSNFLDTLSKALDIFQMVELGVPSLGITLPLLVEAGLIGIGALAGVIGPAVAVGAPHADALRATSRKHFFEGFSIGLVMSANGASENYIRQRHEMRTPPPNAVYMEKRETFKKLHNAGLTLGIARGKQFNTVNRKNFFVYLHSQLRGSDRQYFDTGSWQEWSVNKKKEYYNLLSGMVKDKMLSNNLQLKIK